MYNLMFLAFAALQVALFVWLLRLWRGTRSPAAAVLLVPQFFLIWDNLRVVSGVVLGHGPLLYWLSWPSFWAHWMIGCWLIIASGSILRLAGFDFAQQRRVMAAFCLTAVALMVHDLPYLWTRDIYRCGQRGVALQRRAGLGHERLPARAGRHLSGRHRQRRAAVGTSRLPLDDAGWRRHAAHRSAARATRPQAR